MKRHKILFLTPRFPYPIIGGDRLKPNRILSHLAQRHEVTLVSFNQGGQPPKSYFTAVEELGVRVIDVPLNPMIAGARTIAGMFGKKPLEILYYTQPEFRSVVTKLLRVNNFDLAFAFFMRTAEYLRNIPMKKILMAEDCRTLYQRRSYEESESLKQRMIRRWEWQKLRKYEPEIVNHFDITTLVSEADIESMKRQNPKAEYRLLSNGTDIDCFTPPHNGSVRQNIIFSGKLDIWANQLMLKTIVGRILPEIRKEFPDIELDIVGAKPPQSVMAYKDKGINIYPDVPEMKPYLQKAALFIHPHNGGSGIQNKLLEAMACGCPVVTTPTGNQGINGRHGKELMIGTTPKELAGHAIMLMKQQKLAKIISDNGRKLICRNHSWQVVYDSLDEIISDVMG